MIEIPIVFASNDTYAPMCGVSIQSLIEHVSDDCLVKINILTEYISDSHKKKIELLQKNNVDIKIIDVGSYMEERKIPTVSHLSKETAYRLLIGDLFPQYEKILYIDSDTVILGNVKELFLTDIDGFLLGAARSKMFDWLYRYVVNDLEVSPDNYFNAGILVVNIAEFIRHDIGHKGLEMLEAKRYDNQDQDVLNILCQNKVKFIDGRWNVEWIHLTENVGEQILDEVHKDMPMYDFNPFIVHYDTPIKPWNHPEMPLANHFWDVAKNSKFYEELLFLGIKQYMKKYDSNMDVFSKYLFPWKQVKPSSKVIIYGAGKVGKTFWSQIQQTKYCSIVAFADKDENKQIGLNVPVFNPKELIYMDYDYIVIGIEKEETASKVFCDLSDMGIPRAKIVWNNYLTNS